MGKPADSCFSRTGPESIEEEFFNHSDRLDTGANWRMLALSQAHHRSRLSDSVKNGNALSSVHEEEFLMGSKKKSGPVKKPRMFK